MGAVLSQAIDRDKTSEDSLLFSHRYPEEFCSRGQHTDSLQHTAYQAAVGLFERIGVEEGIGELWGQVFGINAEYWK